ncbi:MAG: hypothetical protein WCT99_00810 [Bacteroidota bacterium]|jgi:hypothetical protein
MKQYKLFVLLIQALCFLHLPVKAGFDRIPQPTSVFGTGVSGVSSLDPLSLWINPASSGTNSRLQTTFFYSPSPFQLPQLSNGGMIISGNISSVGTGLGMHTFGFSLYRENVATLCAAQRLSENIFVGIGMEVYQISIQGYGNDVNIGIDLGLISRLNETISIGVSLQNINAPKIGGEENSIPQSIVSGISYSPVSNAKLLLDVIKDIHYPVSYRVGLEVSPLDAITFRGGVQEETSRVFGGIGFNPGQIRFDYALSSHTDLGVTHSIGITLFP